MGWKPYYLDQLAQEIVLKARKLDSDSLNQAHKMRATCAYGLERFWGEHLRLAGKQETAKAAFVTDVWLALAGVLAQAGLALPATMCSNTDDERQIQAVAEQLWKLPLQDQQAALAVLTALCDAVVWWTQRLKVPKNKPTNTNQEAISND
jgi:hypothetical protein